MEFRKLESEGYNPGEFEETGIAMLKYYSPEVKLAIKMMISDFKGTYLSSRTFDPNNDPTFESGPVRGFGFHGKNAFVGKLRETAGGDIILPSSQISFHKMYKRFFESFGKNIKLKEHFNENIGIVVFPEEYTYPHLWDHMRNQVFSKELRVKDLFTGEKINPKLPFVVSGLVDIAKDDKFEHDVRADIGELSQVYNLPILDNEEDILKSNNPFLFSENARIEDRVSLFNMLTFDNKIEYGRVIKYDEKEGAGVCPLYLIQGEYIAYKVNLDVSQKNFGKYAYNENNRVHITRIK